MGRLPKLQVFGSDYDTPDGTGVRDYIHISDLAAGHVSSLKYILNPEFSGFEPFNLGNTIRLNLIKIFICTIIIFLRDR